MTLKHLKSAEHTRLDKGTTVGQNNTNKYLADSISDVFTFKDSQANVFFLAVSYTNLTPTL